MRVSTSSRPAGSSGRRTRTAVAGPAEPASEPPDRRRRYPAARDFGPEQPFRAGRGPEIRHVELDGSDWPRDSRVPERVPRPREVADFIVADPYGEREPIANGLVQLRAEGDRGALPHGLMIPIADRVRRPGRRQIDPILEGPCAAELVIIEAAASEPFVEIDAARKSVVNVRERQALTRSDGETLPGIEIELPRPAAISAPEANRAPHSGERLAGCQRGADLRVRLHGGSAAGA